MLSSINWKWLIIGALLAMFGWPFISNLFMGAKTKTATQPANQ